MMTLEEFTNRVKEELYDSLSAFPKKQVDEHIEDKKGKIEKYYQNGVKRYEKCKKDVAFESEISSVVQYLDLSF